MRVSPQTQIATRERILEVSRKLFVASAFDAATTRQIAQKAGIAVGTLFNYFPSKEAIVVDLVREALAEAEPADRTQTAASLTFEEDLFAYLAAGMRRLKPLRQHLPVVLETTLSPLANGSDGAADGFRTNHLEDVAHLAKRHGIDEIPVVGWNLYWSLYTGFLAFWAHDNSPRQEDTLALLDESVRMFTAWIEARSLKTELKEN